MDFPNCRNAINDPNQCRLCMRVCDDNFLECIFSDKEYSIAHQIFECTSIRVTMQDNLTKICKNCASLLFMTTEFRNACFKTNRLLMEDFVILELGDWASDGNQLLLKECENFIVRHKQQVDYLYASIVTDSEQCLDGSLEIGTELFGSESQQPIDDRQDVQTSGPQQETAKTREPLEAEEPDPEILLEITKFLEEQTPPPIETSLDREHEHESMGSSRVPRPERCNLCCTVGDSMLERTNRQEELLRVLKLDDVPNSTDRTTCESCCVLLDVIDNFQTVVIVAQQLSKDERCVSQLSTVESLVELERTLLEKMKLKQETYSQIRRDVTPPELAGTTPDDSAIAQDKRSYKRAKITCHVCGKQYDNWKLQTHLNEHDNIRPYVCDQEGCSSSFTGLVLLNRHKKLWHTDYFYAACSVCGKKCKTQGIYQTHISYHEEPKLPCTVCGKLMRNKRAMWKHMKTHSDDRKHVCNICNKKFTIAYTLRVHMRIHTNDKPYPCSKCDKRFQYKCLLKNHSQKYHNEDF